MSARVLLAAVACGLAAVRAIGEPMPTATSTPEPWERCDLAPVPSAAPPLARVKLAGICYPIHSGRAGVFYFDDTPVAHVMGDTPGAYSTGFDVPAGASAGAHELSLRFGFDDGPIVTRVTFTVLPFCRGDCNEDGEVTVAEVLVGVTVALGNLTWAACPRLDPDHDGVVRIADLVGAIADLLTGCLVEPTPTATPGDLPTPVAIGGA